MKRLAAVIISVVFIFTACGRHALESEAFSTAETGNEILETKERTTGYYAGTAACVIAAVAITATVIWKCCNSGVAYNIIAELNQPLALTVQDVFEEMAAIEQIQHGYEVIIDFDIVSEDNKPLLKGLSVKILKAMGVFSLTIKTKNESWRERFPFFLVNKDKIYNIECYNLGNITTSEPIVGTPQIKFSQKPIELIKRLIKITATPVEEKKKLKS